MARLIIQTEGVLPGAMDLNIGVNRIGRAEGNDFIIRHPSVSGYHCEVDLGLDSVRIRDCQSTNGTFVDAHRVSPGMEAPVGPGQVLRFGEVRALVELSNGAVSVPVIEPRKRVQAVELEEGIWSCERHNSTRAQWHCPKCDGRFCGPCLHQVKLMKGRQHRLCPVCSSHVVWINYDDPSKRKKSIWSHVKNFLRGDS